MRREELKIQTREAFGSQPWQHICEGSVEAVELDLAIVKQREHIGKVALETPLDFTQGGQLLCDFPLVVGALACDFPSPGRNPLGEVGMQQD